MWHQEFIRFDMTPRILFTRTERRYQHSQKRYENHRVEWVKEKFIWTDEKWRNVIFLDEKKFNLDGPGGCQPQWFNDNGKLWSVLLHYEERKYRNADENIDEFQEV